jgi:alpha-1,3-mannosyltransferase
VTARGPQKIFQPHFSPDFSFDIFSLLIFWNFFFSGDTGPLVYPAAFVYIYSLFYFVTSQGANIRLAQYIFVGIYLAQMYLVLRLFSKTRKLPPYVMVLSAFTSYRIHSIYVLRLFNDPIAVLLFYVALNLFIGQRWTLGSVFFSLAVGVKMNILLFAPAILLLYITNVGYLKTVVQLSICAAVQLAIGAPFLLTHPWEYLKGSFDLGRVFEYKWTVNYRFLSREVFESRTLHLSLLALHVLLLFVFAVPSYKYLQNYCRLRQLQAQLQPQIQAKNRQVKAEKSQKKAKTTKKEEPVVELTEKETKFLKSFEQGLIKAGGAAAEAIANEKEVEAAPEPEEYGIHFDQSVQLALIPIFLANFIGIVCARSLHYQFYVWYFHSLPYLVWFTRFNTSLKLMLLFLIEFCWNTYPSTDLSSALLHACHVLLLVGIARKFFAVEPSGETTVAAGQVPKRKKTN